MGNGSAAACACAMGRGQHWRALRFGQEGRKHCQYRRCCQCPQGHSGCPRSSTARGSEHCTPAAPAPPPHCTPCSSEGDRRGVSGQGKGADGCLESWASGWWPSHMGCLVQAELALCHLPALGRAAQHGREMNPCMETPWSLGFTKGGTSGWNCLLLNHLREVQDPLPAVRGPMRECLCLKVGFLVWRNNSLIPVPFQH